MECSGLVGRFEGLLVRGSPPAESLCTVHEHVFLIQSRKIANRELSSRTDTQLYNYLY